MICSTGSANAYSLAGNLTAPLFNGGRLRAERRASEAAMKAALASYEQTVLTAFGQVADVLAALEHDAQQTAAQQHALDVAESNLSLTRESYSAGNMGVLQILDAERVGAARTHRRGSCSRAADAGHGRADRRAGRRLAGRAGRRRLADGLFRTSPRCRLAKGVALANLRRAAPALGTAKLR